jgi:hypothetical protein
MKKREKFIFDNYYDGIKKDVDSKIKSISKIKTIISENYKYTGEVKNKKPNGWGKLTEVSKKFPKPFRTLYGNFVDGKLNGVGYIQFGHPLIHIGNFKNNRLNGKGRILYGDRKSTSKPITLSGFEGNFRDDILNGYGIEFTTFGAKQGIDKQGIKIPTIIYKGEWKNGEPNGKGINYYEGIFVCDGNWKNNHAHGECVIQFYGKDTVNGIWKNGKLTKKISEIGTPDAYTKHLFSKITKSMSNQN